MAAVFGDDQLAVDVRSLEGLLHLLGAFVAAPAAGFGIKDDKCFVGHGLGLLERGMETSVAPVRNLSNRTGTHHTTRGTRARISDTTS